MQTPFYCIGKQILCPLFEGYIKINELLLHIKQVRSIQGTKLDLETGVRGNIDPVVETIGKECGKDATSACLVLKQVLKTKAFQLEEEVDQLEVWNSWVFSS